MEQLKYQASPAGGHFLSTDVLAAVADERARQDDKWGGPEADGQATSQPVQFRPAPLGLLEWQS